MDPNNSPQSRADTLWKRFVGMFGGDAVERKFGLTPPPEWVAMMGRLTDFEFQRGVRRLAYSGRGGVPSLPEFTKLCRALGDSEIEEGQQRPALPNPTRWSGDRWDITANTHLLAHIARQAELGIHYSVGDPPVVHRGKDWKPSRQTQELTAILVAYKNAWAQDMREWDVNPATGEVLIPPESEERRTFAECMRRADEEIDQLRRQWSAGAAA